MYTLGSLGRGGATPFKLTIAGAALSSLLSSLTTAILMFNQRSLEEVRFWLAGSVAGREMSLVLEAAPFLMGGLFLAFVLGRQITTLSMGEDVARGLGQNTGRIKLISAGGAPIRLILIGIGLSAALGAFTSFALTFGDLWRVQRAMMWLAGTVYASDWMDVNTTLPWLLVCLPLAMVGARDLNASNLGEDVARGLGLRITLKRGFLLMISVALAGVTVTVAGIIGFVGLIAPHFARRLVGSMNDGLVPSRHRWAGFLCCWPIWSGATSVPPPRSPRASSSPTWACPFSYTCFGKERKSDDRLARRAIIAEL